MPRVLNWERSSSDVWACLALFVVFYLLYLLKNYLKVVRFIWTLGGPPALPLIGNANLATDKTLLHQMSHCAYDAYGPIFRIWLTIFPAVVLFEPADIQLVLSSGKHLEKTFLYRMLHNFVGDGLITSETVRWRLHRKVLQPAFHRNILERFTISFAECADHLANKFLDANEKDVNLTKFVNDSVIDILNVYNRSAKSIAIFVSIEQRDGYGEHQLIRMFVETILGVPLASRKQKELDEKESPFRKGKVVVPYRINHPWLLISWIYDLTDTGRRENAHRRDLFDACKRMIAEKRENLRARRREGKEDNDGNDRKISVLEYMVEVNEKHHTFSEEDIVNECCTFMLAGQDSVGSAVAVTIFLLANHPEWQRKCVDELEQIFDTESRLPNMTDLREMRCLEMCIKEALRLYPSVPTFARKLGEDVTIGKHVIPAGCDVLIVPYTTHRLSHHYPDPHTYNPERFSAEATLRRHPYAYIPFSAGLRNCIGYKFAMLEMKAMISAVLRKFHVEPLPGQVKIRPKFRLTLRAQGGLWVRLRRRTNPI